MLQIKTAGKVSLYEHIVKVIDRIVLSCPDQAIERFEEISYLIKHSDSVKLEEFVKISDDRPYARHSDEIAEGTEASIESLRKIFPTTTAAAVETDPEAEAKSGGVIGLV